MVEKVGMALYERNPRYDQETDLDGRPTTAPYRISWDGLIEHDPGHREDILEDARVAIEAMREPTMEMMQEAGDTVVVGCCNLQLRDAKEAWQVMIDAALADFAPHIREDG